MHTHTHTLTHHPPNKVLGRAVIVCFQHLPISLHESGAHLNSEPQTSVYCSWVHFSNSSFVCSSSATFCKILSELSSRLKARTSPGKACDGRFFFLSYPSSTPQFSSTFCFPFVSGSFAANCCLAKRSQIQSRPSPSERRLLFVVGTSITGHLTRPAKFFGFHRGGFYSVCLSALVHKTCNYIIGELTVCHCACFSFFKPAELVLFIS